MELPSAPNKSGTIWGAIPVLQSATARLIWHIGGPSPCGGVCHSAARTWRICTLVLCSHFLWEPCMPRAKSPLTCGNQNHGGGGPGCRGGPRRGCLPPSVVWDLCRPQVQGVEADEGTERRYPAASRSSNRHFPASSKHGLRVRSSGDADVLNLGFPS